MKTYFLFLNLALIIFLQFSCTHHFYSPNDPLYVSLDEKNDIHISGGFPKSFQIGYSPIKHLGLASNYFERRVARGNLGGTRIVEGYLFSNHIGAYYNFKDKKSIETEKPIFRGILLDTYFGYGVGNVNNQYPYASNLNLKFQKYSWQAGAHLKFRLIESSIIYKLSKLNYHDPYVEGVLDELDTDDLHLLLDLNPYLNQEFGARMTFGFRGLKAYVSKTTLLNNRDILKSRRQLITLGLSLDIDNFLRKEVLRANTRF